MSEYHQITINEWLEMKEKLRRELNNLRTSFVRVGYVLRRMDDTKAYEAEGYKSVAEFAEKEHGLKPSTTSRWMSINREYSLDGYSETLDPRYADMNASQLTEMLALPEKDRELITPETSREDIRELKRFNRDAERAGEEADGPEEEDPVSMAFEAFLDAAPDAAERLRACIRNGQTDAGHIHQAVAPGGARMHRVGRIFLAFNASGISVRTFGGGQETVAWEKFLEVAERWMEDHENEEADREAEGESGQEGQVPADGPDGGAEEQTDLSAEDTGRAEGGEDAEGQEDEEETLGMNPPEAIAPAQFADKSERKRTTDISKIPSIVDEKGQPAPDPEPKMTAKEMTRTHMDDMRKVLARTMADIDKHISRHEYTNARKEAERMVRYLKQMEEFKK